MNVPDRIYSQYRTKPKAVKWYAIARKMGGSLEAAAIAVRNMYDIDTNIGAQLDIIGRIVVLNRDFISNIQLFPGLFAEDDGDQCGDDVNAIFSETSTDTDSVMNDEIYRIAIRAKIFKNNGDASIESILEAFSIIAPDVAYVQVLDTEQMSFAIEFAGDITPLQQWALFNINLVQKPQGVQFLGFSNISDEVLFNDDERQFGDEDAQFVEIRSV